MAEAETPEEAGPAPEAVPIQRTLGLDTDFLVHWAMADAPHHAAVRRCVKEEVRRGGRLGLTLQVLRWLARPTALLLVQEKFGVSLDEEGRLLDPVPE